MKSTKASKPTSVSKGGKKTTTKATTKNTGKCEIATDCDRKISTSNCGKTKSSSPSNCSRATSKTSNSHKNSSKDSEDDMDPYGSYTGNPVGWGKYAQPIQDADDL